MYDLVVTDDSALVVYLHSAKIVSPFVPVKSSVTAADVIGKHVIGELPYNLSCVTLSYTEIPLHLPKSLIGPELILQDYQEYADAPVTYKVTKMYRFPGE